MTYAGTVESRMESDEQLMHPELVEKLTTSEP